METDRYIGTRFIETFSGEDLLRFVEQVCYPHGLYGFVTRALRWGGLAHGLHGSEGGP